MMVNLYLPRPDVRARLYELKNKGSRYGWLNRSPILALYSPVVSLSITSSYLSGIACSHSDMSSTGRPAKQFETHLKIMVVFRRTHVLNTVLVEQTGDISLIKIVFKKNH